MTATRQVETPEVLETPVTGMTDEQRAVLDAVQDMPGVGAELNGTWLWISGDTKPHKETLKALGCMWSPNKKVWYKRPPNAKRRFGRRTASQGYIRARYGSERLKDAEVGA